MNKPRSRVKDILVAGVLGAVVIFVWTALSLTILPLGYAEQIQRVPDQVELHKMLKERITQPGRYAVLYMSPQEEAEFPGYRDEPLYEIKYTGLTHGSVPGLLAPGFLGLILGPILAAWLLTMTSEDILRKYSRKVLFVTLLGLFLAVFGDLLGSVRDEVATGALVMRMTNGVLTWFLAGLVIAWRVRPKPAG